MIDGVQDVHEDVLDDERFQLGYQKGEPRGV